MEPFNIPDVTTVDIVHWLDYLKEHYDCETYVLITASEDFAGHAVLCVDGTVRCGISGHKPFYATATRTVGEATMRQLCRAVCDLFYEFNELIEAGCPECLALSRQFR